MGFGVTWARCQLGGSSRRQARSLLKLLSDGSGLLLVCQPSAVGLCTRPPPAQQILTHQPDLLQDTGKA